jgi:hypothetical protein
MSNEKQSQTSNEKRNHQTDEEDMNKKMCKSKEGLHTKQVDQPDNE